jgi:DNA-binding response OmpR family regulator
MKVLIVEDEPGIASFLQKGLTEKGHEAMVAYDGEFALRIAMNYSFDVILLDLMIPKINGLDVCKKLRNELGYTNSIIMLTALGTSDDIVEGLNSGADDYLVKPVKFRELIARLNSIDRRKGKAPATDQLTLGDLIVDLGKMEVIRDGNQIKLTAREFNLLKYLMLNRNRVLSRMDILENVWEVNFDLGTNVIDVYINYLRKKIDKDYEVKLIHTVVGMGYVMKTE